MIPSYLAKRVYLATPSDTTDLPGFGAIKCKGAAGNVQIDVQDNAGNTTTVVYPISLDETLEVDVRRIRAASTTATGLWVLAY